MDQFVPLAQVGRHIAVCPDKDHYQAVQRSLQTGSNLRVWVGCTAIRDLAFSSLPLINSSTSGCLTARNRSLTLSMPSWGTGAVPLRGSRGVVPGYYILRVNTAHRVIGEEVLAGPEEWHRCCCSFS